MCADRTPGRASSARAIACIVALVAAFTLTLPRVASATPAIQTWRTSAGVPVYFIEAHELPIVDLQLIFAGGSGADPDGREGLALLGAGLLDEGAGGMHANEIGYEFERLGAVYGADVSPDSTALYLRTLAAPEFLGPALDNFRRVVLTPDFPDDAVERQRRRLLTGIQQKKQDPGAIAGDAFKAAIFGTHPYARPDEGSVDSLARIQRADLTAWHGRHFATGNALVALVGDLDRAAAEVLAERIVAGLPAGAAVAPVAPVPPPAVASEQYIEHPSSQTHILVGQPGMKYGDPDYFPLLVGNHILGGGGLVTRLFREIREKHGLSYAAYSYFSPRRENGPFLASLQTQAEQTDRALSLLRDILRQFAGAGPTEEELRAAKMNLTGGFPLRIDSNRKLLAYAGVIGFYDLPLDYLDRFIGRVEAVTTDQIRDAFSRRLDPERMVTILVGPPVPVADSPP